MRLLITSTLLAICFNALGQTFSTKRALTFYPDTYIDTEYRYTSSSGLDVIVQNSLRKGPADSFATSPSPESYLKAFLPLDTMTLDKETLYGYGATGLKSLLDTGLSKSTMMQRTINTKYACLFYIGVLFYEAYAPSRAELVLKDQDFYYRIGGIEIPCGQIVIKN